MATVSIITAVNCIPLRLPFNHWADPPLFAGKPRTTLDSVLVRVALANGLVGWGEAYGGEIGAVSALMQSRVAPLACGEDAADPTLTARLERTLHNLGRSGSVLHALSGLDIALWDLRGKLERRPLFDLLGGAVRSRVPAYASLLQYYGSSARVGHNVRRAIDAGYGAVKLHERSVDAVAAAREVLGAGIPLMVDANCGWTPAEAADAIRPMAAFHPAWIEEPLWPPEDTAALMALKRSTGLPVAVGENAASVLELESLVSTGAADYVQPSVIKSGGVTMLRRLSQLCQNSKSVAFSPQTAFFGPGFLATLHVLAAHRHDVRVERLYCELAHTPFAHAVRMKDGAFDVPDGPGLGADPDAALLGGGASH
jgi:L-alanine-DL-glutamate epimerase-like enolase superfamily enzyme